MPRKGWKPLMMLLLVSGCTTANSNLVTPQLKTYSQEVQSKAAGELSGLGPSCPRTHVEPGCSALRTLIDDYGNLRAQIRKI